MSSCYPVADLLGAGARPSVFRRAQLFVHAILSVRVRPAGATAQFAFPETRLGIIPGCAFPRSGPGCLHAASLQAGLASWADAMRCCDHIHLKGGLK